MIGLSARSLLNAVYALLAERMITGDQAASPVFLAAGVEPREVESMSQRDALDDWLLAPGPEAAARHDALIRYLTE